MPLMIVAEHPELGIIDLDRAAGRSYAQTMRATARFLSALGGGNAAEPRLAIDWDALDNEASRCRVLTPRHDPRPRGRC